MEYTEHLWLSGEGRGLAADALASFNTVEVSKEVADCRHCPIGLTKAGKRAGVQESASIGHDTAFRYAQHWLTLASPRQKLCATPAQWRKWFKTCIESLQLESLELTPYSLRCGGTTWPRKRARLYLNESRAILAV